MESPVGSQRSTRTVAEGRHSFNRSALLAIDAHDTCTGTLGATWNVLGWHGEDLVGRRSRGLQGVNERPEPSGLVRVCGHDGAWRWALVRVVRASDDGSRHVLLSAPGTHEWSPAHDDYVATHDLTTGVLNALGARLWREAAVRDVARGSGTITLVLLHLRSAELGGFHAEPWPPAVITMARDLIGAAMVALLQPDVVALGLAGDVDARRHEAMADVIVRTMTRDLLALDPDLQVVTRVIDERAGQGGRTGSLVPESLGSDSAIWRAGLRHAA